MAEVVQPPKRLPIAWLNVGFLSVVHALALVVTTVYLATHGLSLAAAIIGLVWTVLTIFGISAGYHRLFSHRTFEAHPALRFFLLAFGAAAFQNSAIEWSAAHRRHHARVDTEDDPYDARRGFWYSHVGWVLRKDDPSIPKAPVRDLHGDRLVAWQHRHYPTIGAITGFVMPALLGLLCGDLFGGLVMGGFVRLVVVYQVTFSINSLAHMLGTQPYSDRSTARDSFITALVTMGEGYHNFHHAFPGDYRNGPRAHQFDPTKWIVRALTFVGLTRNLRRTPPVALVRARLSMRIERDRRRLERDGRPVPLSLHARLEAARAAVDAALARWRALHARHEELKADRGAHRTQAGRTVRQDMRRARLEVTLAYRQWSETVRAPTLAA